MKKITFILFLIVCNNYTFSQQNSIFLNQIDSVLPADEVFIISFEESKNDLEINWKIEKGYYLYLNSIKVTKIKDVIDYQIIESELFEHEDEFFGKTKIIRNKFKISIENVGSDASNDMEIHYQGCSDKGFCYPMQTFKI